MQNGTTSHRTNRNVMVKLEDEEAKSICQYLVGLNEEQREKVKTLLERLK